MEKYRKTWCPTRTRTPKSGYRKVSNDFSAVNDNLKRCLTQNRMSDYSRDFCFSNEALGWGS